MWSVLIENYLPGAGRFFKWAFAESNTKVSEKEFELWKSAFWEGHEAGAKRPGNTFQGNFQGDITIKEGGPSKHLGENPTPNTTEAGAESGGYSWSWGREVNDHLLKSAGAGLGAGIVVAVGGATYLGVKVGLAEHGRYDEFMRKQWGLPPKGGPDSRKVSRPFHGPRRPGVKEGLSIRWPTGLSMVLETLVSGKNPTNFLISVPFFWPVLCTRPLSLSC